jgi:hypothetical protein
MLHELYRYALENKVASLPGFRPKRIKAYISLGADGSFISVDPGPEEPVMCPDLGSAANGITKCNILAEKAAYPLQMKNP